VKPELYTVSKHNQLPFLFICVCEIHVCVKPMEFYLNNHNGKATLKRTSQTQEVTL
jgi:hypothetical protein